MPSWTTFWAGGRGVWSEPASRPHRVTSLPELQREALLIEAQALEASATG